MEEGSPAGERVTIEKSPQSHIVVLGDADFISDNFLAQLGSNVLFFQNIVDWLTLGDKLINIRSRGATERPLRPTSDAARTYIRFINIFGVSILVVLFGLVRLYIKRKSKKRKRSQGGSPTKPAFLAF